MEEGEGEEKFPNHFVKQQNMKTNPTKMRKENCGPTLLKNNYIKFLNIY